MEYIEALNRQAFLFLNAEGNASTASLFPAKIIANGLIFLLPILLSGLWLWGGLPQRNAALKAFFTALLSLLVNQMIGTIWFHPRPEEMMIGHTYIAHVHNASFPSDHTTVFAAIGFALLAKETRQWGKAILVTGIAVGWARVFLGVHFPLDIIGAFVVCFLVHKGFSPLWERTGEKITDRLTRFYRMILAPVISRGWIRP